MYPNSSLHYYLYMNENFPQKYIYSIHLTLFTIIITDKKVLGPETNNPKKNYIKNRYTTSA